MTITVGTDTYITVAEADTYVSENYLSTDDQREYWKGLVDGDKEILLRQATNAIERVKFPGIKQDLDQVLSFPRYATAPTPKRRDPGYVYLYDEWLNDTDVPDNVKDAEIEEALEIGSPTSDSKRFDIENSAVKSYKIGNLSETFNVGFTGTNSMRNIIKSRKAQQLLGLSAQGSFNVH